MTRAIFKYIIAVAMLLTLCSLVTAMGRKEAKERKAPPAPAEIRQGIQGKVEIWEGNFMPMIDKSKGRNQIKPGIHRRVRLHEPVKISESGAGARRDTILTRLVKETLTDSSGQFVMPTEPGTYSIFVEDEGGWYYNGFNGEGIQGEVTVKPQEVSTILIKITTKATF
jgi:hypothetical protein